MGTLLLSNTMGAIERGPTSLFPNFTGVDDLTVLSLEVDSGEVEFAVGEVVTGGTSMAFGTVLRIDDLAGVWDGVTASGTATLILGDVTGTFDAGGEALTGDVAGVADGVDSGTAGTLMVNPTSVKGKGVVSIEASTKVDRVGVYTVTLRDNWAGLLCVKSCVIDSGTPDDWEVLVTSEAVATSKTVGLQVLKGGVATSLTTDQKLCLELVLATSKMVPISY